MYKIRIFIKTEVEKSYLYDLLREKVVKFCNVCLGTDGLIALVDVECTKDALSEIDGRGVVEYFPLDNYGDFIIQCPVCCERIEDEAILRTYDENVRSGYDICCTHCDAGAQVAHVRFIGDRDMSNPFMAHVGELLGCGMEIQHIEMLDEDTCYIGMVPMDSDTCEWVECHFDEGDRVVHGYDYFQDGDFVEYDTSPIEDARVAERVKGIFSACKAWNK